MWLLRLGTALLAVAGSLGLTRAAAADTCPAHRCDACALLNDTAPAARPKPADKPDTNQEPDARWIRGHTTYYTSNEGGSIGAGGRRLTPFRSVAVKVERFRQLEGRDLEIRGLGAFVVEDACAGDGCRDLDIYVGDSEANARRLPNWQLGVIPIEYRWLD